MIAELNVITFWRKVSDGAHWMSACRLLVSSKRAIANSDEPRRADIEETGGRRSQPALTSRWHISDVLQPVRQVLRCSAVKSSVDNDRQFELDALGCPHFTGESICSML